MAEHSTRGWTSKRTPIHGLHDRFGPTPPAGDEAPPAAEPAEGGDVRPEPETEAVAPEGLGTAAPEEGGAYPPDLVFIVGPDGTILFVNRELPGVPQGEVLGTSIYEYVFPEQHDVVSSCLEGVFATGAAGGYECSGMRPHDATSRYQCRVAPNHREGRVVSATIIARDITSLKRVEDRLREEREGLQQRLERQAAELTDLKKALAEGSTRQGEQERDLTRFRELLDQAGEAIFITHPTTGKILDVNATASRWLGRSRDELRTLSVEDLSLQFPIRSPEPTAEHVVDTRDTTRPRLYDHGVHRRRDGSTFPVEVAIAHRWIGDTEYVLAIAREINSRKRTESALREAEDHYRSLFTLAHDAVYLSARDGTVAEANDAAVELFGYPRETLIGAPAKQLYRRPEDIRRFQREIAEQGHARDLPVELVRRDGSDGSSYFAVLSATLRRSGDGSLLGYQCVLRSAPQNGAAGTERSGSSRRRTRSNASGRCRPWRVQSVQSSSPARCSTRAGSATRSSVHATPRRSCSSSRRTPISRVTSRGSRAFRRFRATRSRWSNAFGISSDSGTPPSPFPEPDGPEHGAGSGSTASVAQCRRIRPWVPWPVRPWRPRARGSHRVRASGRA